MVLPQILETDDFLRFKVSTLNGPEVRNKGLALFPRKVNGLYAMLSRQDNENIYLMYSDMLHFWYTKELIAKPTYGWELVQLGNCGSPIETEAGWLVLTHGVGPMRKYAMGAFLLDRDDPSRLIGRLDEPLLEPNANEREGYVPNVVYSCGGGDPQRRADHPLRHVRLCQHLRHDSDRYHPRGDGAGLTESSSRGTRLESCPTTFVFTGSIRERQRRHQLFASELDDGRARCRRRRSRRGTCPRSRQSRWERRHPARSPSARTRRSARRRIGASGGGPAPGCPGRVAGRRWNTCRPRPAGSVWRLP